MNRILCTAALLLCALTAWCVPAKRGVKRMVTMPDGTQQELVLAGDEWLHYYHTADGRTVGLTQERIQRATQRRQAARQERAARMAKRAAARTGVTRAASSKRGIVILAEFSDKSFSLSSPKQLFSDLFNQTGYSNYGMGGSVRDYFLDQSYGQLQIDFDVVGPVRVSQKMAYYGGNDSDGNDKHPGQFVADAIKAAADDVDFSLYDWDGDGSVDQVYVIYAGYGEASGASDDTIWPHEWQLSSAKYYGDGPGALKYNGVTIDTYACSNELTGTKGTKVDGIGTACHEFSHCLGLPDMYDTSGSDDPAFGMDAWDIMDYGCYNGDGCVPAAYTAYERWMSGWIEPVVLDAGCEVTGMDDINERGECYVIYNQGNRNEYYLLQNIQQTGWNADAPASGMLVIHVDYDATAWENNEVNNDPNHQRMSPVCADGVWSGSSLSKDLWPYGSHDALTDTSSPAATLFNRNKDGRKFLGRPITDITHRSGLVSFVFNGGTAVEVPCPSAPTLLDEGLLFAWSHVEEAVAYRLRIYEYGAGPVSQTVLSEDFAGLTATTDGSKDVSSSLDSYMSASGWTGTKVYAGQYGAKLGSSKGSGSLTTPAIEVDGAATVRVNLHAFSSDAKTAKIAVVGGESHTVDITGDVVEVTFENLSGKVQFSVTPTKRCYVGGFEVVTGGADIEMLCEKELAATSEGREYTAVLDRSMFKPEPIYAFEVQAVNAAGKCSAWSDLVEFTLSSVVVSVPAATPSLPEVLYDLQGRPVRRPIRGGIYIKNGCRFVFME